MAEQNVDQKAYEWLNKSQLSYDIWNKKYRFNEESFDEWLDRVSGNDSTVKRAILEKRFIFGGRILANRGTQNYQKVTFSNCYVIPPVEDSIEGIYKTCAQLARTYSYGGGCGVDISNLRPKGALVNNSAKTTSGAVSFMSTFDEVTKVIGQNGRRAALMISMDVNHPDVLEFINIKTDLDKVTSANISIRVNNDFMRAVKEDDDYILRWPCNVEVDPTIVENCEYNKLVGIFDIDTNDNVYIKKVKAKELFTKLVENNWNYAEPGILYWDRIDNYNLLSMDPEFEYAGVNPCAEEPLPAGGSCLLGSINLAAFVEGHRFNMDLYTDTISLAVVALNNVLDEGLELHPLDIQKNTVRDYRQIGLGIMGYADTLIKMGIKYGSDEAITFTHMVGSTLAEISAYSSSILAKNEGTYPKYNKESIFMSEYFNMVVKSDYVREHISKYGLRNSQLLTIAPTGSISTMWNISGGMEPIFAKAYTRTTKSLHGEDVKYVVYPKVIEEYLNTNNIDLDNLPDFIVSSEDITPENRVKTQATWQYYIDASISSTINLPKEATVKDVYDIYMQAYERGLKGVTVFRAGCARTAILQDINTKEELPRKVEKRPKDLEADYYQVKVKGEQFIVLVGLLNGKPYEVFTFRPKSPVNIKQHKGKITKVKKMHYSFDSEYIQITDLQLANENIEEKAATLYASMLLRHNVDIKYIVKTAKKVNDNITSFSSAMCRILSKYIPVEETEEKCSECNGVIINENGCRHCKDCGWSACG